MLQHSRFFYFLLLFYRCIVIYHIGLVVNSIDLDLINGKEMCDFIFFNLEILGEPAKTQVNEITCRLLILVTL